MVWYGILSTVSRDGCLLTFMPLTLRRPLQGYGEQRGVNTRALEELFNLAEERRELGYTYEIQVNPSSEKIEIGNADYDERHVFE
jgi:hypothetical protein